MIGLKLITLACLLAVAFATPVTVNGSGSASGSVSAGGSIGGNGGICSICATKPVGGLGGLLENVLSFVGNIVGGLLSGIAGLLSNAVVSLGVGLTARAQGSASLFVNIGKLGIPKTINDVVNVVINLGIAIGGVVNVILEGVGELVATLLVAVFKVLVCVVGYPGKTGTPDCCKANFGSVWGVKSYTGAYTNVQAVVEFYEVLQIEAQILTAVNVATNGGGVVALQGNARFIVQWLLEIIGVCKKSTVTFDEMVTVVVNLVTIAGAIGNSCQSGLGAAIVVDLINRLSVVLTVDVLAGVDLRTYISVCQERISVCKRDALNGAVDLEASLAIVVKGSTSVSSSGSGSGSSGSGSSGSGSSGSGSSGSGSTGSGSTGSGSTGSGSTGSGSTGSGSTGSGSTGSGSTGSGSTGSGSTGSGSTGSGSTGSGSTGSGSTGSGSTGSGSTGSGSTGSGSTGSGSSGSGSSGSGSSGSGSSSGGAVVCNTCMTKVVGGLGSLLADILIGVGAIINGVLTGVTGLLSSALASIGVGITSVAGGAASIFVGIGKLGAPSNINDVVNVVVNLGIGIGGIVNVILGGSVGESIATLLVGVFKILLCVVGSPAISGTPECCAAKYGSVWGVKSYGGPYVNANAIVEFYEILNIEAQIVTAVNVVTNGGGVVALQGNARFIIQWLLEIISVCKKSTITMNELVTVVVNVVTITGAIGNSCKFGLGANLVADLLNKLSVVLNVKVLAGVDLQTYVSVAQKSISVCKEDRLNGAINVSASASIKVKTTKIARRTSNVCNTCATSVLGGLGVFLGSVLTGLGQLIGGILTGVTGLLSNTLTGLAIGITSLAGGAAQLFIGIGKLGIPNTINDVVNVLINLGIAIGGVVNVILEGVGEIVATLLVALFKILVCVVGLPGIFFIFSILLERSIRTFG
ncbi:hypothetical protein ACJJTC_015233, partial [Scirpophaga incertulas]